MGDGPDITLNEQYVVPFANETDFPLGIDWPDFAAKAEDGTLDYAVDDAFLIPSVDRYVWVVAVGGVVSFWMAWGIGANDVANAFATSVGAGSISLMWACIIGGVMEFLGAVLLGKQVTDTVRKGIIDAETFDPNTGGAQNGPEVLMVGNLSALLAAALWLQTATAMGLPVSTTHSIIGSLIGVGLVYEPDSVQWLTGDPGDGLGRLKGVVGVIVSWFISPLLSGIFAIILFLIVRTTVLRRKNPVRAGFVFTPALYGFAVAIMMFFIFFKGAAKFDVDEFGAAKAVGIGIAGGVAAGVITWFLVNPALRKYLESWERKYIEQLKNPEKANNVASALKRIGVNVEITEELSDEVLAMHDNSEKFDLKTERLFSWVQVFTAAFDSFSHGANDVANSIGPFASIWSIYSNRGVLTQADSLCNTDGTDLTAVYLECADAPHFGYLTSVVPELMNPALVGTPEGPQQLPRVVDDDEPTPDDSTCYLACTPGGAASYDSIKQPVPIWILVMGGAGIVVGLATWGYKIIVAIGTKLTKLTPSRGFCIELGASIAVLIASSLGLPVSTTHCQVGATVGVGLAELKGNTVNWKQFLSIFAGWVVTLIFAGLVSSGVFAIMIYSPMKMNSPVVNFCPGEQFFVVDNETLNVDSAQGSATFRGIACSGLTPNDVSIQFQA